VKLFPGLSVCLEGVTNPPKRKTGRMDLAFSTVQTVTEVSRDGSTAKLTGGWTLQRIGSAAKPFWQSVTHPGLSVGG
jgi:hypothetical protein